jgi:RNA polymerase sigma-70 factor (ECF subfamily)
MKQTQRDDPELVRAANDGDMGAFEELVRHHTDAVYAHAYRFFGDVHAAQDATQEVWVNVFRALPEFEGRSAVSTWLFRITRNVCLDMLRAGRRVAAPVDPIDIRGISADNTSGDATSHVDLQTAMRALSPEDRDAFNAVALFGLPYADAAGALGVPAGTVKSRVFRARRALVALLNLDAQGGDAR